MSHAAALKHFLAGDAELAELRHQPAAQHLQRAIATWEGAGDTAHRDFVRALLSMSACCEEDSAAALRHGQRALEIALSIDNGSPEAAKEISRAHLELGIICLREGRESEAITSTECALAVAERAASFSDAVPALTQLSGAVARVGQLDRSLAYLHRAETMCTGDESWAVVRRVSLTLHKAARLASM